MSHKRHHPSYSEDESEAAEAQSMTSGISSLGDSYEPTPSHSATAVPVTPVPTPSVTRTIPGMEKYDSEPDDSPTEPSITTETIISVQLPNTPPRSTYLPITDPISPAPSPQPKKNKKDKKTKKNKKDKKEKKRKREEGRPDNSPQAPPRVPVLKLQRVNVERKPISPVKPVQRPLDQRSSSNFVNSAAMRRLAELQGMKERHCPECSYKCNLKYRLIEHIKVTS